MGTVGKGLRRRGRTAALLGLAAWLVIGPTFEGPGDSPARRASAGPDTPRPGDDATYRPTVMIRKGKALGTGTIIASVEGETLILTASHVVEESGSLHVELFRYNLGLERTGDGSGFPRKLAATVAARDPDADLAILRVRGQLAFPYVARMAAGEDPPPKGTEVTTIGFDKGERLIGFSTRIKAVDRIDLDRGGGERPFLVTEHPPEIGRSGGGLFRKDGALVGVCVGRAEMDKGRKIGLFTTLGNVKGLIRAHEEITATVARSKARPKSPAR
jgi:S1-C subfamily serine protease